MAKNRDRFFQLQVEESLDQSELLLKQARLLATRLERLTPDSAWARRASGCRGTLIRLIAELEQGKTLASATSIPCEPDRASSRALQRVLQQGFTILHAAARESLNNNRRLI
jgi:hypothetical protein